MDQVKIGKFIAERRRAKKITQASLAESLGITDRAVSKWETGKAMPDSALMLDLCMILEITVNDLLNGEVTKMEQYSEKSEQLLVDMVKQKEEADKKLLLLEILICTLSVIILIGFCLVAAYFEMTTALRATFIVLGFVIGLLGFGFALWIEQVAGYYECANCGHRHVPTYFQVLWAPHFGRTRWMRCPECKKMSYQKKRIKKDS
ncbi:MAG: helix-turn-helix transcriptional regulator [Clostridia bacterium]|nr:helix-turn-helix transcriptional regulator [Clostridia bacterium]